MKCYLCKDAGHGDQPAHRDLGNGKGVCRFHYEGSMMPATTPAIDAGAGLKSASTHEPKEISLMRNRIDPEKVRELHGQGLSDKQIAEKLRCSGGGVLYARKRLGLPAIGKRGPRKSKGHGTVGDAMARISRRARLPKLQRKGADRAAKGGGTYAQMTTNCMAGWKNLWMIENLTVQRDKLQAAIDALSEL